MQKGDTGQPISAEISAEAEMDASEDAVPDIASHILTTLALPVNSFINGSAKSCMIKTAAIPHRRAMEEA